jgi:hypothetical protein
MFIAVNLPDGTQIYVNPDTVTWFQPQIDQALHSVLHFTDGTELTVAQIPAQIMALIPSGP